MLFPVLAHLPNAHLQVVPTCMCVCVFLKSAHTHLCVFNALELIAQSRSSGLHGKMFFLLGININKLGNFLHIWGNNLTFYAVTLNASTLGVSISPSHEAICGIPLL